MQQAGMQPPFLALRCLRRTPARRQWRRRAESRPREEREVGAAGQRPDVGLDRHPAAPPASRPRGRAACSWRRRSSRSRTTGCAAMRLAERLHRIAAAIIATPMTLRMSTFRKLLSAPQPSSCDCSRKRNASAKTCRPRLRASAAAAACPTLIARDDAAIAIVRPARNRNSGAARPATNTVYM